MAHLQQQRWLILMRSIFPKYFRNCSVLDVGSANINGSNRFLFDSCSYIGVDMMPWKGVNKVMKGKDVQGRFNTVICTEALEHDPDWGLTLENIINCAVDCLVVTCAINPRPEHGTKRTARKGSPFNGEDYYQNIDPYKFLEIIKKGGFLHYRVKCTSNGDLYFIGFKYSTVAIYPSRFTFLRLYFYRFFLNRLHDIRCAMASLF